MSLNFESKNYEFVNMLSSGHNHEKKKIGS